MKETILLVLLSIILPSLDVYSDLVLIVKFYIGRGTMMVVPFLLNYLICWYVWATTDKWKAVTCLPELLPTVRCL